MARTFRLTGPLIALSLCAGFLVGCNDVTGDDDDEPQVVAMRLTFGTQAPVTYTGAAGENRAVRVPIGTTTVTAQFLRSDGTPDPVVTTSEFTLRVTPPAGSTVTFTPSGSGNSFTGSLNVSAASNNVPVVFALRHVPENHDELSFTVNITAP